MLFSGLPFPLEVSRPSESYTLLTWREFFLSPAYFLHLPLRKKTAGKGRKGRGGGGERLKNSKRVSRNSLILIELLLESTRSPVLRTTALVLAVPRARFDTAAAGKRCSRSTGMPCPLFDKEVIRQRRALGRQVHVQLRKISMIWGRTWADQKYGPQRLRKYRRKERAFRCSQS